MRLIDANALADRLYELSSQTTPNDGLLLRIIAGGLRHDRGFAPTIEAEPVRHGRWVSAMVDTASYYTAWGWRCSCCGYNFEDKTKEPKYPKFIHYCPNCGAKMDLEGNE